MKWDIQTVGFTATDELQSYVKDKVSHLSHFYDQIVGAEVYLKLVNAENGDNKVADIKLNIPGNDIMASSRSDKFEGSINESIDKLKRQIDKLKTKLAAR
jgi:ribosomal subunit interface protein